MLESLLCIFNPKLQFYIYIKSRVLKGFGKIGTLNVFVFTHKLTRRYFTPHFSTPLTKQSLPPPPPPLFLLLFSDFQFFFCLKKWRTSPEAHLYHQQEQTQKNAESPTSTNPQSATTTTVKATQ